MLQWKEVFPLSFFFFMLFLRACVFYIICFIPTSIFATTGLVCLFLPPKAIEGYAKVWLRCVFFLMKIIHGIHYKVEGLSHIPKGPFIIASKHQSTFETFVYPLIFNHPVLILKTSLLNIPFWGWFARKYGAIGIDRTKPKQSLKHMIEKAASAGNRPLLIFPEGTRTKPGQQGKYQNGIAILYEKLQCPVLPIAVNTGLFWGKRSFIKYPGTATIKILPPLESGLTKQDFMKQLEASIETESHRLLPQEKE